MKRDEPKDVIPAYVGAFQTLDTEMILPFYGLPCLFISPAGATAVSDIDSARALLSLLIEQARSQNYRRTQIAGDLDVRPLAANLASVTGVYVRFDANDREILRFGFTYLLRDDGNGWKIIVAMAHDEVS